MHLLVTCFVVATFIIWWSIGWCRCLWFFWFSTLIWWHLDTSWLLTHYILLALSICSTMFPSSLTHIHTHIERETHTHIHSHSLLTYRMHNATLPVRRFSLNLNIDKTESTTEVITFHSWCWKFVKSIGIYT